MTLPKLVLHIGPPKTATTSLQYCFSRSLNSNLVNYLGTRQPKSTNQPVFTEIYNLISTPSFTAFDQQSAAQIIKSHFDPLKINLLSEEGLLVDTASSSWQHKLKNISMFSKYCDVTLVICLRDPHQGLPSLYNEMCLLGKLQKRYKLFPRLFCYSNQARIFNYLYLLNVIKTLGFSKLRFFSFDWIKNNSLSASDFHKFMPKSCDFTKLIESNVKSKVDASFFVTVPNRWQMSFELMNKLAYSYRYYDWPLSDLASELNLK